MFDTELPCGDEAPADRVVVDRVAAVECVLSDVASLSAAAISDEALAAATLLLEHARRLLDAAELSWLAELDRRGATEVHHGQRCAAWLAHEAKLPRSVAASRVRTARVVTNALAPVGDALRAGLIGFDHARVLASVANPRNCDALAGVVAELCDAAAVTSFDRWSAEVRGLADLLDADGGHDPADDLPDPHLSVHRVGDVTVISGQLAGDGAHVAQSALDQLADELFAAHTRDAALTGEPVPSRARLLAEAFVELCRRGLATDMGSSRPPRVEATVVINAAEPERVTDADGRVVADPDLLLCDAVLWPIITTFDSVPLAMGRSRRFAAPHQVRAVNLRDGGCVFPGCDAPANWVDLHHVDHWSAGGASDAARMCGLCRSHHRLAHRTGWSLELDPDGWTRWTRPDGQAIWGQRHQRQRHGRPPSGRAPGVEPLTAYGPDPPPDS